MTESAKRDRRWLFDYLNRMPGRSPRERQYLRFIAKDDGPLDLTDPGPGEADRDEAYATSRYGSSRIGLKAFLYRTPGTPQHHQQQTLDDVLRGLRTYQQHQDERGRYIWGDGHYYNWGIHEHGWRLEPLLLARIWLDEYLSKGDRKWIDAALAHGAEEMLRFGEERPTAAYQYNNRGAVWAAVTQLCGLYFNDRRMLDAVRTHADRIITHIVDPQGQVGENTLQYDGGGPCTGYSYTGWTYVQMHRLLTGEPDRDERLRSAVRWFARFNTRSGYPVAAGASVRRCHATVGLVDVLPALEFFADRDPAFDQVASRWLKNPHLGAGHCVHGGIWALFAHQSRRNGAASELRAAAAPAASLEGVSHHVNPPSDYTLVTHRYQTAVTFRGLFPFMGLQSFAYGNEPPLVHHTETLASTTRVGKLDLASTNVDAGPSGWEVFRRTGGAGDGYEPPCPATFITTRRGNVWECYVFTPASVVYLIGGSRASYRTRWVLQSIKPQVAEPVLDRRARVLSAEGREARLYYHGAVGALKQVSGATVLDVTTRAGPALFALGAEDFQFERVDRKRERLTFSDRSGRYTLDFSNVLAPEGHLSRKKWHRVQAE